MKGVMQCGGMRMIVSGTHFSVSVRSLAALVSLD